MLPPAARAFTSPSAASRRANTRFGDTLRNSPCQPGNTQSLIRFPRHSATDLACSVAYCVPETPGSSTGLARREVVDPAMTREQAAGPAWPARRKFTNRRVDIEGHPWRRVRGLCMSEAAAGHAGPAAVTADLIERLRSGKLRAF